MRLVPYGVQPLLLWAMYVRGYGCEAFLRMRDRIHAKDVFAKTQEILGQDPERALRILEEL